MSEKDKRADCDLLTKNFMDRDHVLHKYRSCYADMVDEYPSRIYKMYKLQTREEISLANGKKTLRESYKVLFPKESSSSDLPEVPSDLPPSSA